MADTPKGPETVDEAIARRLDSIDDLVPDALGMLVKADEAAAIREGIGRAMRGLAADVVELAARQLDKDARAHQGKVADAFHRGAASAFIHSAEFLRSLVSAPPEPSRDDTDGMCGQWLRDSGEKCTRNAGHSSPCGRAWHLPAGHPDRTAYDRARAKSNDTDGDAMTTLRPGMRVRLTSGGDLGRVVALCNGRRCRVRWDGGSVSTERLANIIPLDPAPPAPDTRGCCVCERTNETHAIQPGCPVHGEGTEWAKLKDLCSSQALELMKLRHPAPGEVVVPLPDVDVLEFIALCVYRRNTEGTDNEERWQKEALDWLEGLTDRAHALKGGG